jgi:hypothetical protein
VSGGRPEVDKAIVKMGRLTHVEVGCERIWEERQESCKATECSQVEVLRIQLIAQSTICMVQLARSEFRPCNGHRIGSNTYMELPGNEVHMPFVTYEIG